MRKLKKENVSFLVKGAVIGALYAVLTVAVSPISYGPLQFRVSEALTILPALTPAAIPGLFVGCIIANAIGVAFGMNIAADIVFGSVATLCAAFVSYAVRKVTIKGFPVLSFLPPILFNAVVIGLELSLFVPEAGAFLYSAATVGVGEFGAVVLLGIPVWFACRRTKVFDRFKR